MSCNDEEESLNLSSSSSTSLQPPSFFSCSISEHFYEKFPEKAADLQAAQVALSKERVPKKLIHPGNTRWNSFVDSWIQAVELKPLIIQQGQIDITT